MYKLAIFVGIIGLGIPLAVAFGGPVMGIGFLLNSWKFKYEFHFLLKIVLILLAIPLGILLLVIVKGMLQKHYYLCLWQLLWFQDYFIF